MAELGEGEVSLSKEETLEASRIETGRMIDAIRNGIDETTQQSLSMVEQIAQMRALLDDVSKQVDPILDRGGYDPILAERKYVIGERLAQLRRDNPAAVREADRLFAQRQQQKRQKSQGDASNPPPPTKPENA